MTPAATRANVWRMPHLWAMCLTYNLRQAMKKLLSILVAATCMAGLTTPVQAEQTPDGLIAVGHFEKLEGQSIGGNLSGSFK